MMAPRNLKGMDVDSLLTLRAQIDEALSFRRRTLQEELSRLERAGGSSASTARVQRQSTRKGVKVEPKYRDPETGMTWAARGARPRWLTAKLESGAKLEDFLIDKEGGAAEAAPKSGRGGKRGRKPRG